MGSEARDVSAAARARVSRPRAACRSSSATTISKRRSCARASSIPTATRSISRSRAHWGFTPLPTQPRRRRKTASRSAAAATSKTTRSKAGASTASRRTMRFCGTGIARSRGCASTARRAARSGRTSSRPSSRRCSRSPPTAFPFFTAGERTVHADGHVEVAGAFYPVPLALLGQRRPRALGHAPGARLPRRHARRASTRASPAGVFAPRAGEAEASTRQQAFVDRLVGQCARVGPRVRAVGRGRARGPRRPRDSADSRRARPHAPASARARPRSPSPRPTRTSTFAIRPFVSSSSARRRAPRPPLRTDDPAIRPMTQYTLEDFLP